MNGFWLRLTDLIKESGTTQYKFAEDCDIPILNFNRWKAKQSIPRADIANTMAENLGVTLQYLLNGESGDDPAVEILLKYPEIRDLVMRLGECPENVGYLSAYLTGRLEALDERI